MLCLRRSIYVSVSITSIVSIVSIVSIASYRFSLSLYPLPKSLFSCSNRVTFHSPLSAPSLLPVTLCHSSFSSSSSSSYSTTFIRVPSFLSSVNPLLSSSFSSFFFFSSSSLASPPSLPQTNSFQPNSFDLAAKDQCRYRWALAFEDSPITQSVGVQRNICRFSISPLLTFIDQRRKNSAKGMNERSMDKDRS